MTDLEKRIAELKSRSCCLVPKPEAISKNSYLLTSHEYDYCRCDIDFIIDQLQKHQKALDKLREQRDIEAIRANEFYDDTIDNEEINKILNGGGNFENS